MAQNRLFPILCTLVQSRQTTAQALADRFAVSARTIYRDLGLLQQAGIPLRVSKGKGGGIELRLPPEQAVQLLTGLCADGKPCFSGDPDTELAALRSRMDEIRPLSQHSGVRLYFRPEVADRVRGEVPNYTQQPDGSLVAELSLPDTPGALRWLLSFGLGCVVLEPPELREKLAQKLRDMIEYYI